MEYCKRNRVSMNKDEMIKHCRRERSANMGKNRCQMLCAVFIAYSDEIL